MPRAGAPPKQRLALIRRLNALHHRVLSVVMMMLGLRNWAIILGLAAAPAGPFTGLSAENQIAIMNVAAAELVAATGLWMPVPWGTVVWIYAALSEIAMHTIFAGSFGSAPVLVAVHGVALGTWIALRTGELRLGWLSRPRRPA